MTPGDYEFVRRLLRERSGLVLAQEKDYLVDSRLSPVARRAGFASVAELVRRLRTGNAPELAVEITEAMMNNESFFFRDKVPFDHFTDTVLPDLMERRARSRRLAVWSAAASTGQEPYSIAMALEDAPLNAWSIDLLASDISNDALEKAQSGSYSQFEVQRGLPIQLLMRHFAEADGQWRISSRLRSRVRFRQINLVADFPYIGTFDVIFCRNVLIYFDQPTKIEVLRRIRKHIAADGYLIMGAAETMVGLGDQFVPVRDKRGLYRPQPLSAPALTPVGGLKVA